MSVGSREERLTKIAEERQLYASFLPWPCSIGYWFHERCRQRDRPRRRQVGSKASVGGAPAPSVFFDDAPSLPPPSAAKGGKFRADIPISGAAAEQSRGHYTHYTPGDPLALPAAAAAAAAAAAG